MTSYPDPMDILYVGLMLVLVAVSGGLILLCEKL
jgi:hypothetical protein